MLTGALVTLFFAWNGSQMFEDLEMKQSVMIHRVKATGTPTVISITGAHFDDCAIRIFRNGWIDCRDTFYVVLCL